MKLSNLIVGVSILYATSVPGRNCGTRVPDANEVAASFQRVKQWAESGADATERLGVDDTIEVYTYINIFKDSNGNGAISAAARLAIVPIR
jgi:hypothetical protein